MTKTLLYLCSSVFIGGQLLGCTTNEKAEPTAIRKDQDAALKDPFNYGPNAKGMSKSSGAYDDVDPTDISGGGTSELNKRAFKRDWDAVWGK
jgi:hypothetical protein